MLTDLDLFYSGYNSTEAFNDRRLVELAHLIPFGPTDSENVSREDASLPVLNTALCLPDTPITSDNSISDNSTDGVMSADSESTLVDLKLGVSVPVTLADGFPLTKMATQAKTKTVTEAEPLLPHLEIPYDQLQDDPPPPAVTPDALQALERLLGVWNFDFCFVIFMMLCWFRKNINYRTHFWTLFNVAFLLCCLTFS